jgi:hypothetical protein
MFELLIITCLPSALLTIELIYFLFKGKRLYHKYLIKVLEVIGMLVFPFLYLYCFDMTENDCCTESAAFSPDHRLTVYFFLGLFIVVYFYTTYDDEFTSPIVEVLKNGVLLFAFAFNVVIGMHVGEIIWMVGNVTVAVLIIFSLIDNHRKFLNNHTIDRYVPLTKVEKWAWRILNINLFVRIPLLLIAAMPVLLLLMAFLLLFGQKPDSIVRAFTDTYKHGFSQLDYMCDNVSCGGHFLCSVAANGHKSVVKPIRYGSRHGHTIMCNRQLLVANAFEELIEDRLPKFHKVIRSQYDKVGDAIHRHYYVFNQKIIADTIYVLMKPLEYVFIFTLYLFDKKPENRIALQYIKVEDKKKINEELKKIGESI